MWRFQLIRHKSQVLGRLSIDSEVHLVLNSLRAEGLTDLLWVGLDGVIKNSVAHPPVVLLDTLGILEMADIRLTLGLEHFGAARWLKFAGLLKDLIFRLITRILGTPLCPEGIGGPHGLLVARLDVLDHGVVLGQVIDTPEVGRELDLVLRAHDDSIL